MKYIFISIIFALSLFNLDSAEIKHRMLSDSKPWTRWWWFASIVKEEDVRSNLNWLKDNNFGGVEIAWIYPLNRMQKDTVNYTPRQEWLGNDWSKIVAFTKRYADSIGIGCDYTFGTLWPFGDSKVPREEASRTWEDTSFRQEIKASWEYPLKGYVINHLDKSAFEHYASRLNAALKEAYKGTTSSLFCDSWEVETKTLWTPGFDSIFEKRFYYRINKYMDSLWKNGYEKPRYDYFKLLSEIVLNEFYIPFSQNARMNKATSRAQCMGAPVDILKAYSFIDFPETEAMLYEPSFSRVVASSAALSGKNVITSETFTCLYGWPRDSMQKENVMDLKLVCDALFANGTNQIIWHGTPMNPEGTDTVKFYATVHVGKQGSLAPILKGFNSYMEKVSTHMKKGRQYSDVALYLPLEDSWVAGEYPPELQMKWSWGEYELRYLKIPNELKGYHPLWVNGELLKKAKVKDNFLIIGDMSFKALYIDCKYLDLENLKTILALSEKGVQLCLGSVPKEPGMLLTGEYDLLLNKLKNLRNVYLSFALLSGLKPLIEGNVNNYWCRQTANETYIFIANPLTEKIKYPIPYNFSGKSINTQIPVVINLYGKSVKLNLNFEPNQSILLKIEKNLNTEFIDIQYTNSKD